MADPLLNCPLRPEALLGVFYATPVLARTISRGVITQAAFTFHVLCETEMDIPKVLTGANSQTSSDFATMGSEQ